MSSRRFMWRSLRIGVRLGAAFASQSPVSGVVTGVVKGGFTVDVGRAGVYAGVSQWCA